MKDDIIYLITMNWEYWHVGIASGDVIMSTREEWYSDSDILRKIDDGTGFRTNLYKKDFMEFNIHKENVLIMAERELSSARISYKDVLEIDRETWENNSGYMRIGEKSFVSKNMFSELTIAQILTYDKITDRINTMFRNGNNKPKKKRFKDLVYEMFFPIREGEKYILTLQDVLQWNNLNKSFSNEDGARFKLVRCDNFDDGLALVGEHTGQKIENIYFLDELIKMKFKKEK